MKDDVCSAAQLHSPGFIRKLPHGFYSTHHFLGFPIGLVVKNQCKSHRKHGLDPWVGKTPWRRKWQPTLVLLPGESHGQRSLAGDSPWGHKSQTRLSD